MQKATGTQRKLFCLSNNLLQTQNQMCTKLPASRQRFPPSRSVLWAMTVMRTPDHQKVGAGSFLLLAGLKVAVSVTCPY